MDIRTTKLHTVESQAELRKFRNFHLKLDNIEEFPELLKYFGKSENANCCLIFDCVLSDRTWTMSSINGCFTVQI